MREIHNFIKSYNELTNAFAKKYYGEDAYVENEIEENDRFLHPIGISDEWWDIGDIFLAMNFSIPKEIVLKWCDYDYNQHIEITAKKKEHRINFYHFILQEGKNINNK